MYESLAETWRREKQSPPKIAKPTAATQGRLRLNVLQPHTFWLPQGASRFKLWNCSKQLIFKEVTWIHYVALNWDLPIKEQKCEGREIQELPSQCKFEHLSKCFWYQCLIDKLLAFSAVPWHLWIVLGTDSSFSAASGQWHSLADLAARQMMETLECNMPTGHWTLSSFHT